MEYQVDLPELLRKLSAGAQELNPIQSILSEEELQEALTGIDPLEALLFTESYHAQH